MYRKSLRIGAWAVIFAFVLRLLGSGILQPVVNWLGKQEVQSFFLYLETGRVVRFSPSFAENANYGGESGAPMAENVVVTGSETEIPLFTAEDADLIDIRYSCSLEPDLEALLSEELRWDLTGDEPTVLVIHTHTTESYTKNNEDYEETSAFRTLEEDYNMLSIGDALTKVLEDGGITVIHDRELHDYPSYNGSYAHARSSIRKYLEEYPTIQLVLDLHRDASGDIVDQLRTTAQVNGEVSAQLMLVMGTNASGLEHPNWQKNLALGLKLQLQLERIAPGITRPISLRSQRFNQDLTEGSLLIEVGAAGNTHAEAVLAAEVLGQAILELSRGANISE